MSACPSAREQHLARLRRIAYGEPRPQVLKTLGDALRVAAEFGLVLDSVHRHASTSSDHFDRTAHAARAFARPTPSPVQRLRDHIARERVRRWIRDNVRAVR